VNKRGEEGSAVHPMMFTVREDILPKILSSGCVHLYSYKPTWCVDSVVSSYVNVAAWYP
jgi:hypothetical protein